ncbi:hypothetical protein [Euzebya sp.]|uniref:hypothetical protein n=1 Tax=Euzebya sp. TaxID=1971409 RepID=UPI003515CD4C
MTTDAPARPTYRVTAAYVQVSRASQPRWQANPAASPPMTGFRRGDVLPADVTEECIAHLLDGNMIAEVS